MPPKQKPKEQQAPPPPPPPPPPPSPFIIPHLQSHRQQSSILEILDNVVGDIYGIRKGVREKREGQNRAIIKGIIQGYGFGGAKANVTQAINTSTAIIQNKQNPIKTLQPQQINPLFINMNRLYTQYSPLSDRLHQIIYHIKQPGIKRHLMPNIPIKSKKLRNMINCQYGEYVGSGLEGGSQGDCTMGVPNNSNNTAFNNLQQFQRRRTLLKIGQMLNNSIGEITATAATTTTNTNNANSTNNVINDISNRIWAQYHDTSSLLRQLYDQDHDQLLLASVIKTNKRRLQLKQWQLPQNCPSNFTNWLNNFKNPQGILERGFDQIGFDTHIAPMQQTTAVYSLPDQGLIVGKRIISQKKTTDLLYSLRGKHHFGVDNERLFSRHYNFSVNYYHSTKEIIIISAQHGLIRISPNGNVFVKVNNKAIPTRTFTPDGYVVVHHPEETKRTILHPNGSVSKLDGSYTTRQGHGLKGGAIHDEPTLLRRSGESELVKREDGTTIISSNLANQTNQWLQFADGTEMCYDGSELTIQLTDFPLFKINKDHYSCKFGGLTVSATKNPEQKIYSFVISYPDMSSINISSDELSTRQHGSNLIYVCRCGEQPSISATYIAHGKQQTLKVFNAGKGQLKRTLTIPDDDEQPVESQFTLNPLEDEDAFYPEEKQPEDYQCPRVFIIKNYGSGIQLLSDHMLKGFFDFKRVDPHTEIFQSQQGQLRVITKLPQKSQTPLKIIQCPQIQLDVFKTPKRVVKVDMRPIYQVRSFNRVPQLTAKDIEQIRTIEKRHANFKKQNFRDSNQYGFKQKGDPSVETHTKRLISLNHYRRLPIKLLNPARALQIAQFELQNKREQERKLKAKNDEQQKLRTSWFKRETIVQNYVWIPPKPKEGEEDISSYPPPCVYKHYFITVQGSDALWEIPEAALIPPPPRTSVVLDPEIRNELDSMMNRTRKQQIPEVIEEMQQRYDTQEPNIAIAKPIILKPSVFTQQQIDQERDAFEKEKKAYEYHEIKRKQFNLYGAERQNYPAVPSLLRTQPISEINQKYLLTEAPFDKKVKISSMKNKLTSQASSLAEMRKQGPHALLIKTIDKRNDYSRLLERRTMMVHADLNDKLQRDVLINPAEANFGFIEEDKLYQLKIDVKNQDILSQRLLVKRPKTLYARAVMMQMGPLALGMIRKIVVTLQVPRQQLGRFTDEFQIHTKHEIYHIPIIATVLNQAQFKNDGIQLAHHVKEVVKTPQSGKRTLPPLQ